MLIQAIGILYTVDNEGVMSAHSAGNGAAFSLLYNIINRKYAMTDARFSAPYEDGRCYYVLNDTPNNMNVCIFSPEKHTTEIVDVYLMVMAPDMYTAEKSMRTMLKSKSNINSKEIPTDVNERRQGNYLLFTDYPEHKIYYFKVARNQCIGEIHDLLDGFIEGDNIKPLIKYAA